MEFGFFIVSYGRPQNSTGAIMKSAQIVIAESQYKSYRAVWPEKKLIVIPDEKDGSYMRAVNSILELSAHECNVITDDDLKRVYYVNSGNDVTEREYLSWAEKAFIMCEDLGCHIWGLNASGQKLYYETNKPFSLTKWFQPTWLGGIIRTELRMDESFLNNSDVDFWAQHMRRDKMGLRVNLLKADFRMHEKTQTGGIDKMNREREFLLNEVGKFHRKWGNAFLQVNSDGHTKAIKPVYRGV